MHRRRGLCQAIIDGPSELAPLIDHGSSVELVRTPFPARPAGGLQATGVWRFCAISVADVRRDVTFPDARGTWEDAVTGEALTANGDTLTVPVPGHRVRLLSRATRASGGRTPPRP